MSKLTQKRIDRLTDRGRYGDGRNLYLHVGPTGAKSWAFIYRRGNKDTQLGLGSYPDVSLEDAREKAGEYRKMLRQGIEPPKHRRARKPLGTTFKDIADRYIKAHRESWRGDKSEAQWRSSLADYAYPSRASFSAYKRLSKSMAIQN